MLLIQIMKSTIDSKHHNALILIVDLREGGCGSGDGGDHSGAGEVLQFDQIMMCEYSEGFAFCIGIGEVWHVCVLTAAPGWRRG